MGSSLRRLPTYATLGMLLVVLVVVEWLGLCLFVPPLAQEPTL